MKQKAIVIIAVTTLFFQASSVQADSVVGAEQDLNIKSAPSLSLSQGEILFSINGRIMVDFATWDGEPFSGVPGESGAGSELRRARIYLKGKYHDWQYRLQTDFADDKTRNKSAYIKYTGFELVDLYIGKHKEPFGLENLSSSKYISAMERSASNANFAGARAIGFSMASSGKHHGLHVGVFDVGSTSTEANFAVTGRATYVLQSSANHLAHFGLSYSARQHDDSEVYAIENRAGVHPTSIKSIISGDTFISDSNVYGLELAYAWQRWTASVEYSAAKLTGKTTESDRDFSNYYLQLSYFITDDKRKYSVDSGTFGSVSPSSPKGAMEIFSRFEGIDLSDNNVGTDANIVTLGLNWFATKYTRVSLNYVYSDLEYAQLTSNGTNIDGSAFSLRAQFHW